MTVRAFKTEGPQADKVIRLEFSRDVTTTTADSVTVIMPAGAYGKGRWTDSGVSWTITTDVDGAEDPVMEVEHSLMPTGYDESKHWVPDSKSPFAAPSNGVETHLIHRIRFTDVFGDNYSKSTDMRATVILISNYELLPEIS